MELNFEQASTTDLLSWAYETYADSLAFSTAFGPSGLVLMHLTSQIHPNVKVFFIDTGYHFQDTLDMVDRVQSALPVEVEVVQPQRSVAQQLNDHNGHLHQLEPDRCCDLRKVAPTRQILRGKSAWITARRRDQGHTRANLHFLEPTTTEGRDIMKLNPLFKWTRKEVWQHIYTHDLPYNRLADEGYTSVGCAPCTRPATDPNDERSGRWSGRNKTECGLHTSL